MNEGKKGRDRGVSGERKLQLAETTYPTVFLEVEVVVVRVQVLVIGGEDWDHLWRVKIMTWGHHVIVT